MSCTGSRWATRAAGQCCSCTAEPGAGAGAVHRRFFDPEFWRVVIFDQRGAGRSRPLGSLENNTTQDLVSDIETLRRHLGLERWVLFGGSWGLHAGAGVYAQAFPERVIGCVLRGVFLGRPSEVEWFLQGVAAVFPDAHAAFTGFLRRQSGETCSPPTCAPDRSGPVRASAGGARLVVYEGSCSTLLPSPRRQFVRRRTAPPWGWPASRRTTSPTTLFLPDHGLLGGMHHIGRIPAEIRAGRYDMICRAHGVRAGCGLAGSAAFHRAGRRAFGAGAWHPPCAGCRGRALPSREMRA